MLGRVPVLRCSACGACESLALASATPTKRHVGMSAERRDILLVVDTVDGEPEDAQEIVAEAADVRQLRARFSVVTTDSSDAAPLA